MSTGSNFISRRAAIVEATLDRVAVVKDALAKSRKKLSDVSDALDAADLYIQDDYIDALVQESGKAAAEVVELLRNIRPRLQETHDARIAEDLAAVQDYQRWQSF